MLVHVTRMNCHRTTGDSGCAEIKNKTVGVHRRRCTLLAASAHHESGVQPVLEVDHVKMRSVRQ